MRTIIAAFVLAAATLPAQIHDTTGVVNTTLTALRADPEAFKHVKVSFTVQFASLGQISNPFFTKFTPTDYVNMYAWADEQPIWRQDSYADLFGMLYYSKTGPALSEVYELQPYQRLQITGIVRNTFQNMPWIEVMEFSRVAGETSTAVLAHLYRGEQHQAQRRWQRAIAEFEHAASNTSMPSVARYTAHKNLGMCYLRVGEADKARGHLAAAQSLANSTDSELTQLATAAGTNPESELDRTVDPAAVKDHQRPMWEAFEGGKAASKPAR